MTLDYTTLLTDRDALAAVLSSDDHDSRIVIDALLEHVFKDYRYIRFPDHEDFVYCDLSGELTQIYGYGPDSDIVDWETIRNLVYGKINILNFDSYGMPKFKGYRITNIDTYKDVINDIEYGKAHIYRPMPGGLTDALANSFISATDENAVRMILEHFEESLLFKDVNPADVVFTPYGRFDNRIGWNTHIAIANNMPILYRN